MEGNNEENLRVRGMLATKYRCFDFFLFACDRGDKVEFLLKRSRQNQTNLTNSCQRQVQIIRFEDFKLSQFKTDYDDVNAKLENFRSGVDTKLLLPTF